MSWIPDRSRITGEMLEEQEREIEMRAERYSEQHGDEPPHRGAINRLLARIKAALVRH